MGGGWLGEQVWKATEQARPRAKAPEDSPAARSGCATALGGAEHDELPRPAIDPAVAPVAPVGEIARWQELLTPCPVGSGRRRLGDGCGISGDVGPGDSGPGAPLRYTSRSSNGGFLPGRTSGCNRPSRTLDSPISSGYVRGSGGHVASRKQAPDVPEVSFYVEMNENSQS